MLYSRQREGTIMKEILIETTEIENQRLRLADRLKEYRKRIGMSQLELANQIGRAQSVVSSWEIGTGVPDANYLPTLAKALGVSVADLCGTENVKGEDMKLIDAYHQADPTTKKNVRLLLGMER